jgi:hypothetical protein
MTSGGAASSTPGRWTSTWSRCSLWGWKRRAGGEKKKFNKSKLYFNHECDIIIGNVF